MNDNRPRVIPTTFVSSSAFDNAIRLQKSIQYLIQKAKEHAEAIGNDFMASDVVITGTIFTHEGKAVLGVFNEPGYGPRYLIDLGPDDGYWEAKR
jgi:hypothetical protein